MDHSDNAAPQLMGFWMALALVMGSMIGSGIFLLPVSLAPLGWNSVMGWLVTIGGTLCVAAVFARLARALPNGGGPYAYTREAFGHGPAFAIAWAYWISMWVGNAAIATAGISYLSRLIPVLGQPLVAPFATIAVVWLLTWVNLRGARLTGGVQLATTVIKILPLVAVVVIAALVLGQEGQEALALFRVEDLSAPGIATAATLTLWAMLGIEIATVPSNKVRDPERIVPRATLAGGAAAGLVYILVCSAIVLMLPPQEVAASAAPMADFVERYWGADAGLMIAGFGAISALGAMNGWILAQGELAAALARDDMLPRWMAQENAAQTPVNAHIVSSALLSLVILLNGTKTLTGIFEFLILLTTSIVLFMYIGCVLAAGRLAWQRRIPGGAGFVLVLCLALIYACWAVYGAGTEALIWGSALLMAGIPVYWLMQRRAI